MKENVIIVNFKIPREAYQVFARLREKPKRKGFKIYYGALMKKVDGNLTLEDGFAADGEEDEWGMMGAMVGGLTALQGGSVGALAAGGIAKMLGMKKKEMKGLTVVLEKVSECVADDETFLLLAAKEKDETSLAEKLEDYQISITRLDEKEIADEIRHGKKSDKKEKESESETVSESPDLSGTVSKLNADMIIKNAKIFTSDRDNPQATAFAVKDGRFVYVGDEAGLSDYEGEVTDLGGRFIMPGIIDSHVHVTFPVGFEYSDMGQRFECDGKQGALDFMSNYIKENPGLARYKFVLEKKYLNGEEITKEDLDAICPDAELLIQEGEGHSIWINSKLLERHGITDDTPDPVPGLSYYVRKDGHLTGNIFEGTAEMPIILDSSLGLTDDQIDAALKRWIDYSVHDGVTCVFDSGIPGFNKFHERVYKRLRELDLKGELPVYIDGCYVIASVREMEEGLKELKRFNSEYNTEHLKVHTMKVFMDGTRKIHTAAMVTPYSDTGTTGSTAFSKEELAELLKALNETGMDLHLHTVGERASQVVLDGVELARKELGDDYHVRVTCAHLELQDDADLPRFAELGVIANYTPWWHSGDKATDIPLHGDKADKMFRCKTLWDSGALVTWSCDNIVFGDFMNWSPYLGMEIGMTRIITGKTRLPEYLQTNEERPPASEKMNIEEMLLGYTINGAKQLGIEKFKGSIAVGKDADFLVFENDLLTAEHDGFSQNAPKEVYFAGKKLYKKDNKPTGDMKREFKDLIRTEPYEFLNSEITGDYDKSHAVKCLNGTFVGAEEYGVASWLGIPYAKPPVGERRFKAPEYVDESDRVFEARYYGKCAYGAHGQGDCIQKLTSEDCLYLNIWVNEGDKTGKKPVMFWIHGGAYVAGSGSQGSYCGANLVQAHSDIVLVTINYRLNMYGFMDFSSVPGGENFGTAPCNGLLDQAMALRWVHENIAAFGGDPDNVTIFGQSAGGGSVSILPVMKEANRYFQKVIAQSGSTGLAFPVGCEAAQGKTKALLEYTGCKTMDDIMALSEEKLQEAYVEAVGNFTSCPYYGTEVLPEAPIELYKKGLAKHISIMAGSTADECRLFMGEDPELTFEEHKIFAQRAVGDALPYLKEGDRKYYEEFKQVCRTPEPGLVETEFMNDIMFRVPMLQQLDAQSAFNKTFCYYWSYPGSNEDMGAAHSVELVFVFNDRGVGTTGIFNGSNVPDEIFTTVQQMWTNFARCGDPSTDQIEWKAYSVDDQNVLDIAGPGNVHIVHGLLAEQYKAVLPLVGYYQFMDKYFTPGYLLDIVAERGQNS